jgi:hypothetical protein
MNVHQVISTALGTVAIAGSLGFAELPAKADTASTAAIVAGAAGIVGALLYDANNHPYYIRGGHRYYVTAGEANYYRSHHHGVERRAFVPEQEYDVRRDPYHGGGKHR